MAACKLVVWLRCTLLAVGTRAFPPSLESREIMATAASKGWHAMRIKIRSFLIDYSSHPRRVRSLGSKIGITVPIVSLFTLT